MRIHVTLDGVGTAVEVAVSAAATVGDLKAHMQASELCGVPVELQRLYHCGRELADDSARLLVGAAAFDSRSCCFAACSCFLLFLIFRFVFLALGRSCA